jgi:hypothetical protein
MSASLRGSVTAALLVGNRLATNEVMVVGAWEVEEASVLPDESVAGALTMMVNGTLRPMITSVGRHRGQHLCVGPVAYHQLAFLPLR